MTKENKIYFTLRLAIAICFIGHGAFGIITKQVWCNYFGVFGIDTEAAYRFMPVIGIIDIVMGTAMLVFPMRIWVAWLVFWGLFTALLRPLSGEPFAEFVERSANWGAPLALLLLIGSKNLFKHISPDVPHDAVRLKRVTICLKMVVFLLLAGHGWLNLMETPGLINQYASIGLSNPASFARYAGIFEIAAGIFALTGFAPGLLLLIFAWKILSEAFYPAYPLLEWLERGGSYGAILALWFTRRSTTKYLSSPASYRYRLQQK